MADALVNSLAEVDPVAQRLVDEPLVDRAPALGRDALGPQRLRQHGRRADLDEPLEDHPHRLRLGRVHHQLALLHVVSERRPSTHPHALRPRRRELVPDPLGGDLALELGERQQDVERQPAHRRGRVERLRHRHERDAVSVEHLHQLGEVGERAGQAVDLVDDHDVDQPVLNVGDQAPVSPGRSNVPPEKPPSS